MTESEAIDKLNNLHYKIVHTSFRSMVYVSEIEALCMAKDCLKEIQQYRAIGTVEEFKSLKEKNEPKKPLHQGYVYACPCCNDKVNIGSVFLKPNQKYCTDCGTEFDWQ